MISVQRTLSRLWLLALAATLLLPLGSFSQTNSFKISSSKRQLGKKLYEQNDHVGSVRAVVSDAREVQRSGTNLLAFTPRVGSWTETYAFGSNAPARTITSNYRYGFNGMEQDDELNGDGNSYTTDYRMYDPRVGRWMSTDPVRHFNWSPYNAFDDNPIALADPSGADADGGWDIVYTESVTNWDYGPGGVPYDVGDREIISMEWNPNIDYNRFVLAETPKPGDTRTAEINGTEYQLTFAAPPYGMYVDAGTSDEFRRDQYSDDLDGWLDDANQNLSDVSDNDRLDHVNARDPDMISFMEATGALGTLTMKVSPGGRNSSGSRGNVSNGKRGNANNGKRKAAAQSKVQATANTKVKTVVIDSKKYPASAEHIRKAQANGQPSVLTINRTGAKANRKESLKGIPTKKGMDRDEYPPAMFQEGGTGASVKHIPLGDNRGAGSSMGHQLRGVPDGTKVRIIVK